MFIPRTMVAISYFDDVSYNITLLGTSEFFFPFTDAGPKQKTNINSTKDKDKDNDYNNDNNNPLFDRKVDIITAGLATYAKSLKNDVMQGNALIICDCILSMKTEINLSDNYRKSNIDRLVKFSKFHNHKPFRQITREDVLAFLDNLRKPKT